MKESNNNEEISIKIQTLDNIYPFKINPSFTILQLKEEISKKYKIPKDRQRLIFQGKFLKENEKLSYYKITDGCVVQLIAKSLEENNNNSNQSETNSHNNGRVNEVYPIIQIPFRTHRRRRVVMPHFDISEYYEGFYQNLISLDNYNKCKNNFNYNNNNNNVIEAFDFSKSTYEVGEWVDVKDTINQWLEAQVIKVQNNKAYVHYNGWGARWDEWIEFSSPRMRNFKTYTLQTPLSFSVSPYPAIPCDSNIEPQQRPIDIFYYVEKTKRHLENLLDEMNKLLNLRKSYNSLFEGEKFSKDNYEILFKATQMIPFLDRIGRMLSDISLVFSHFIVNPNYYSSFLFGYKRQDLFNEVFNMKKSKNNDIFDDKNNINEINKTENKDTQTPPLENKFLKNMESQTQKTQETKKTFSEKNNNNTTSTINSNKKTSTIINNNSKRTSNIDNKEKLNKIEVKKDKNNNNNINSTNTLSDNNKDKIMNKIEDKKKIKTKDNNQINNYDKDKKRDKDKNEDKNDIKNKNKNETIKDNINNNEQNQNLYHRHNSYSAPSLNEDEENVNTANFQRQRQRITQEEILPNQISTNLGYDLSYSSIELPFVQRIIYSYTRSDRIISPSSPFYQIFSNRKLFPRVNLQIPTMLPPGEVIMMTGYSPFPETNFDIFIHTISVNPNNGNENDGNNNNDNNNMNNNQNNNVIRNLNNIININNNPNNNTDNQNNNNNNNIININNNPNNNNDNQNNNNIEDKK